MPCEEFTTPETPISWAPFYGKFTQSGDRSGDSSADDEYEEGENGKKKKPGQDAVGGYNPDAYEPGVGQEPTPAPSEPPASGGGGGGGGGQTGVSGGAATGGIEGG